MKKRGSIGILSLVVFFLLASFFLLLYKNTRLKSEFLESREESLREDLEAESIANFFRSKLEKDPEFFENRSDRFHMSTSEMTEIKNTLDLKENFYLTGLKSDDQITLLYSFEQDGRKTHQIKGKVKEEFSKEDLENLKEKIIKNEIEDLPWTDFEEFTHKKGSWVFFEEEGEFFYTSLEDYEKQLEEWEEQEEAEIEETEEDEEIGEEIEEIEKEFKIIGEDFEKDLVFTGEVFLLDSIFSERIHFLDCEIHSDENTLSVKDSIIFTEDFPENITGTGDWLFYNEEELENFTQENAIQRPVKFEFLNFSKRAS